MPTPTPFVVLAPLLLLGVGCIDTTGLVFGGGGGAPDGTYAAVVLADQPLAYWPLDEFNGIQTEDLSGNGHTAEMGSGPVATDLPGQVGDAVSLTEQGKLYVDVPHPFGFGSGSYTLEAWVKVEGTDASGDLWGCKPQQPSTAGYTTYVGNGDVHHKRYDDAGDFQSADATSVPLASFKHLVFVYDHVAQEGTWYADRGKAAPSAPFDLQWGDSAAAFDLASATIDAGDLLFVDEVAVYDEPLSTDRIEAHFLCGSEGQCD